LKSSDFLCGLFSNSQGGSLFQVLGLSVLNSDKLHAPTWSFCVVLKKPVILALPMLQGVYGCICLHKAVGQWCQSGTYKSMYHHFPGM